MTAKLRGAIKARDNYTCRQCSVSLASQPHLLLEVDHIVPVSKGGLSIADNLQTLCWRCNRSKSNKMPWTTPPHVGQATAPPPPVTNVRRVSSPPPPPAKPSRTSASLEVEGQLVKLRELYEAGLFTDTEYEEKRAALLDRA